MSSGLLLGWFLCVWGTTSGCPLGGPFGSFWSSGSGNQNTTKSDIHIQFEGGVGAISKINPWAHFRQSRALLLAWFRDPLLGYSLESVVTLFRDRF